MADTWRNKLPRPARHGLSHGGASVQTYAWCWLMFDTVRYRHIVQCLGTWWVTPRGNIYNSDSGEAGLE